MAPWIYGCPVHVLQVKVDLPSAFQDFVAIMLGYNASIAILKACCSSYGDYGDSARPP